MENKHFFKFCLNQHHSGSFVFGKSFLENWRSHVFFCRKILGKIVLLMKLRFGRNPFWNKIYRLRKPLVHKKLVWGVAKNGICKDVPRKNFEPMYELFRTDNLSKIILHAFLACNYLPETNGTLTTLISPRRLWKTLSSTWWKKDNP